MSEFGCSGCEYTSSKKENIIRHINKSKSCSPGKKEIIEIPIDINCEYCNKKFSSSTCLYRHIKNCKQKEKILKDKIKTLESKIKQISIITKEVEELFYIYLIKIYPYEDNIYKLGRTVNIDTRLSSYKRYKIIFITSCDNFIKCENDLLSLFKKNFIQSDIGNEYFIGNYRDMKKILYDYFTS
jgi:hypothetical protein